MSTNPIWKLLGKLILISMLLAACAPTATPAAQATWETRKDSSRLTESAPTPSAFEEIGKIEIKVPKGGTNFEAFSITAIKDTKFTLEGKLVDNSYGATGFAEAGNTYWISFEAPKNIEYGDHESFAQLSDSNGGKQTIQLLVHIITGCDFKIPAGNGTPEAFFVIKNGDIKDLTAGTTRFHVECIKDKPVYTIAQPDKDCLADTIQYGIDGTWGCYVYLNASTTMWTSVMGGEWHAPYGKPDDWTPPPMDIRIMFPPQETPTPIPGVQQG